MEKYKLVVTLNEADSPTLVLFSNDLLYLVGFGLVFDKKDYKIRFVEYSSLLNGYGPVCGEDLRELLGKIHELIMPLYCKENNT